MPAWAGGSATATWTLRSLHRRIFLQTSGSTSKTAAISSSSSRSFMAASYAAGRFWAAPINAANLCAAA